jgi:phosphoglycolate phosphatase-like HAD superfamily hydrolase
MTRHHTDAVILDFDGVLVESIDVKTRAFASLYAEYGTEIERQVVEYHLAHSGISRYVKFRHYHEKLLGIPYTDTLGEQLSERFSRLAMNAIVDAPFVAGAKHFLDMFHRQLPLFVASGTPEEELREIVRRRAMQHYFHAAYGSPATKGEILRGVVKRHGFASARVLMVGDAIADLDGAREANTAFVGRVIGGHNPFPAGVATIDDLSELADRI